MAMARASRRPRGEADALLKELAVGRPSRRRAEDIARYLEERGALGSAREVTVVATSLTRHRLWQSALCHFRAMRQRKISADVIAYNAALSACAAGAQWQSALSVLWREMAARGLGGAAPDRITFNTAIGACARAGRWQPALHLLAHMRGLGLAPDVVGANAAITACERGRQWQRGLDVFAAMPALALAPDEVSYNAAIACLDRGGQWRLAFDLLRAMPGRRVEPSPRTVSAAICACAAAHWEMALALLRHGGATPDVVSYNAAMHACASAARWQQALLLLAGMPEALVAPDATSFSTAMSACEKRAKSGAALQLLRAMGREALHPDVVGYSAAVSACEKGLQWQAAVDVLRRMRGSAVQGDEIICNAAISACAVAWQTALWLFEEMASSPRGPGGVTCGSMLNALALAGRWRESSRLLAGARARRTALDAVCRASALRVLEESGELRRSEEVLSGLGRRAARQLRGPHEGPGAAARALASVTGGADALGGRRPTSGAALQVLLPSAAAASLRAVAALGPGARRVAEATVKESALRELCDFGAAGTRDAAQLLDLCSPLLEGSPTREGRGAPPHVQELASGEAWLPAQPQATKLVVWVLANLSLDAERGVLMRDITYGGARDAPSGGV